MKKKKWFVILIVIIFIVLLLPIPTGVYKDGGTRAYSALTYKIVDWNRIVSADEIYDAAKVYFFPNNLKSIDSLWAREKKQFGVFPLTYGL